MQDWARAQLEIVRDSETKLVNNHDQRVCELARFNNKAIVFR
eukprot:SAG31_NODE_1291_length_8975_cov_26.197274_11_plen_42_part_00